MLEFFRRRSLLARVRWAMLGLAVGPLLLAFGFSLTSQLLHERHQLHDQYQRRVERKTEMLAEHLQRVEDRVMSLQRFWTFSALPVLEQKRLIHDVLASSDVINAIDYHDAQGQHRLRVSERDFSSQASVSNQIVLTQVMASGQKSFGRIDINPATGEPSLILALPVIEPRSARMTGILSAEISLKQLWREFARLSRGTEDDFFVVSADQQVIAHDKSSVVLADVRYLPPRGVGVQRDLQGRLALVAVSQLELPGNTLSMVLTRPLTSVYGFVIQQAGWVLLILLCALLLGWRLVRQVTQWLLEPVVDLTDAARRLSLDEQGVEVPGPFEGEMATLATALNRLLTRMRDQQQELERRVQDRTWALAAASEQAQQAHQMLQTVLDTIPARIYWKDRNLTFLGCNLRFAHDAGKTSVQEVVGQTDYDMSWRQVASHYRSDDLAVMGAGQPKLGYEEPKTLDNGVTTWIRTSKVPLRDLAGHVIGVLGIYEDITEMRQAQEDLRLAKETAEQASRAKSLFLSSMSHELRTPLNAIMGYAQLLEMTPELNQEVLDSAHEIRHAGQHLLELVNDILDLARIEAGRMDFHIEPLPLGPALAECLSQNVPRAAQAEVTLVIDPLCHEQRVLADHRRVVQVFNNLISNAIKYNRTHGQVRVCCSHPAPGYCRVEVTDTGPGMTPQQQTQLFQPFNRVGAEMSQIEGTGIGLTITKQLVEGMGGSIGVESVPQQGSTFWVEFPVPFELPSDGTPPVAVPTAAPLELPLVSVQAPVPSPVPDVHVNTPAALPAQSNGQPAAEPLRVLVAEDYGPSQTVLRLQLESLGCQVDVVEDGAVALLRWRKNTYDLILSDLNMPVMDGPALARAVRQNEGEQGRARTPIIAITAAAVASELQRCRDAGMDDTLVKPVPIDALRAMLSQWAGLALGTSLDVLPVPREEGPPLEAVFDVTALYRVLGQVNQEEAQELVDAFLDSARTGLNQLMQQSLNAQLIAREMHKQKSAARTVGAMRYAGFAEALEGTTEDQVRDIYPQLVELRRALDEVQAEVMRWQASASDGSQTGPDDLPDLPCVVSGAVLVVDDDPVVHKQMHTLLKTLGAAEVLSAQNGTEAILAMSAHAAELDVVVCDLNMPEMDGVELIRRFGQTDYKGNLVLISGADLQILTTASRLAELQGLRVLGQLSKPVLPQALAEVLQRASSSGLAPKARPQAPVQPKISVAELQEALSRNEFQVWFQPKVDSMSLRPIGLEALARWRRPDGSFVPPNQFITLAEREGLIDHLSQILTELALRQLAQLHEAGHELKLAINLSATWLDNLHLPEILLGMVHEAGLQPRMLVMEVTETGVMADLTTALDVLTRLRLKGFGLSIDDFGIGYSSFEQLARIPFTEMKLDRSFVHKGSRDPAARAILESSMGMAQKLGLVTVAEGVETVEDLALVREIGCDNVQGYLVARPMPIDELLVWLANAWA